MKTPNLNLDAMSHWIRRDTITWCNIEDNSCLALLDTSVTINVITADYARILDLPMGPLSDLALSDLAMSLFASDLTK